MTTTVIDLESNTPTGPARLPSILTAEQSGRGPLYESTASGQEPRPFVVGYIDAAKLPSDSKGPVSLARAEIAKHANTQQLALGNVYVDYPGLGGSSFRSLLMAIERYKPLQVLIPRLAHVDSRDDVPHGQQTRQEQIERRT